MRWLRLLVIFYVALKYGLDEFLFGHERIRWLRPAARLAMFWRRLSSARAVRLRLALQDLGPIFVIMPRKTIFFLGRMFIST